MGINEKYKNGNNNKNSNNEEDEQIEFERKSSSLSDLSNGQIYMPLSPTPDSLSSFRMANTKVKKVNSATTTGQINKTKVNAGGGGGGSIKSPKSLNDANSSLNNGNGNYKFGFSNSNTPILSKAARAPISTNLNINNGKAGGSNGGSNDGDFLQTYFELDPMLNDYDMNLYAKNFSHYHTNYHTPRFDYDEYDYLVFDRIKQRIAKRDLSLLNRKTPFGLVGPGGAIGGPIGGPAEKELNVKIDITTDGAKIREMTKSRNSNFQRATNNSRNLNIDYLTGDVEHHRNQKHSIATLPSLSLNGNGNGNVKSNRLKKDLKDHNGINNYNENFLFLSTNNTPPPIIPDEMHRKSIDPAVLKNHNNNIHEYLYSLSKKTQFDTGYVDAFKEAQRRRTKVKSVYTIEDYRKYEINLAENETDGDKLEKTKKRNDYANYVRSRNSQLLNDTHNTSNGGGAANGKDTQRSLPVNNRLAPLETKRVGKAVPKNSQSRLNHQQQKTLTHSLYNN